MGTRGAQRHLSFSWGWHLGLEFLEKPVGIHRLLPTIRIRPLVLPSVPAHSGICPLLIYIPPWGEMMGGGVLGSYSPPSRLGFCRPCFMLAQQRIGKCSLFILPGISQTSISNFTSPVHREEGGREGRGKEREHLMSSGQFLHPDPLSYGL